MGGIFPNRADIDAAQLKQLRALFGSIIPANSFYSRKLADGTGLPEVGSLDEFFGRIPFTTKQEIASDQLAHPPYGTNLTYSVADYSRIHQTSGTSGTPLRWLDTAQSWDWVVNNWIEVYHAAGVTRGDRVFFAFSFGPFIGFWAAFEAATRIGSLTFPGGGLNSLARLQIILDNNVTVLCCTPTYAIHLAEVAAAGKINLARGKVRALIVAGEPGGSIPATRKRLEELWPGATVFDHHGMTETGPISVPCPACPGNLHVLEMAFIPEILDLKTQRQVQPGETGELVLTNLGRVGSPLIRYRTGDIVRPIRHTGPCRCGRYDLTLEGGILGRADDMVVVRGVNIFPSAVESVVRGFGEVAEYQVELDRSKVLPELRVKVEPIKGATVTDLAKRIERAFETAFSLRVPVEVVPSGTLPRFDLKARRWKEVSEAVT